eukprot:CAMPEP_0114260502 /NCGR_PEP_ID=MMETSP0058-20121206/20530_1 /TAXON_ID=36894 /ORGANISM="Pyramimonas parkeae, CCMP726" /LENGTH=132 /DNA_ID=CAMNT_0001375759 /DNA_START=420 /DNA_END=819 /DNA_ORIENTATION=+
MQATREHHVPVLGEAPRRRVVSVRVGHVVLGRLGHRAHVPGGGVHLEGLEDPTARELIERLARNHLHKEAQQREPGVGVVVVRLARRARAPFLCVKALSTKRKMPLYLLLQHDWRVPLHLPAVQILFAVDET